MTCFPVRTPANRHLAPTPPLNSQNACRSLSRSSHSASCSSPRAQQSRKPSRIQPHRQRHRPRKELPLHSTTPIPTFKDIAEQSGLTASHISSADKHYVVESMSGGVGVFRLRQRWQSSTSSWSTDRPSIAIARTVAIRSSRSGTRMPTSNSPTSPTKAGLAHKGWGMGVAVADFDNDGNLDLYVTGYGGNALYRNKGNCTFEDVTDKAKVQARRFLHRGCLGRLRSRWQRRPLSCPATCTWT